MNSKKSTNKNVTAAARVKRDANRDEFYTTPKTAEGLFRDVDKTEFRDKIVYCNCDEPWSEIYKYLKKNFSELGLRHLVATAYRRGDRGLRTDYDGARETMQYLRGDGDFRSGECREILSGCDIAATNPPFSLQTEYIATVHGAGKKMLIICNMMALFNARTAPLTFKMALGETIDGARAEEKQDNAAVKTELYKMPLSSPEFRRMRRKICHVHAIALTTLRTTRPKRELRYSFAELESQGKIEWLDGPEKILNVNKLDHIPRDYAGEMAVPTSLVLEKLREDFDFLRLNGKAKVNGKNKFYRVHVRLKKSE